MRFELCRIVSNCFELFELFRIPTHGGAASPAEVVPAPHAENPMAAGIDFLLQDSSLKRKEPHMQDIWSPPARAHSERAASASPRFTPQEQVHDESRTQNSYSIVTVKRTIQFRGVTASNSWFRVGLGRRNGDEGASRGGGGVQVNSRSHVPQKLPGVS